MMNTIATDVMVEIKISNAIKALREMASDKKRQVMPTINNDSMAAQSSSKTFLFMVVRFLNDLLM
jgi:hypothetical protein